MNSDWKVLVQVIRPGERYNSECLQPSVKHGGGSFMAQNPRNYEHRRVPSKHLIGNSFIFQHGNDPKHTANAVKDTRVETHNKAPSVMNWPPVPRPQHY